ncbi:MAG TPA: hypothetical protein PKL65_08550 [Bacteroidales bacterium]|nr:hypothetical protein [Bacteroidales bacterium]HNR42267.1 hypothetical protein [Bacteroidales bacterium]HPM17445.1 hypothetical protein [Bacteroidales bacterium]
MRTFIFIFPALMAFLQAPGIHADDTAKAGRQHSVIEEADGSMNIAVGKDFFSFDENDSSVTVRLGSRGIKILESLEGKKVEFEKYDTESECDEESGTHFRDDDDRSWLLKARRFRGHLAGFEAGLNNYIHEGSMVLPGPIDYMSPETSNSWSFNLNFSQLNIGFGRYSGLVTGMGLNWNNYRFRNHTTIEVGEEGTVTGKLPASSVPVRRSKFSTLYLNVPLLFEIQIPAGYNGRLNLAAGVTGGLKLNAWTKIVYKNGEKSRVNGDYNLNLLRGGFTGRVGYRNFMIYGTYYPTPWFQKNRGPEGMNLEPFEIGLAFTFND